MAHKANEPTRRPVAFFNFTADDLSDENIDATAERVAKAIRERSSSSSPPGLGLSDHRVDTED